MRELIERFSYRFRLWQKERYGDYLPADPAIPRNPLRIVAIVAIISVVLGMAEPFLFHRAFDVGAIIGIVVPVVFLALYRLKSRWAWHLVVGWLPFTLLLYWVPRLAGYGRYQLRVHSTAADVIGVVFQAVFFAVVLVWLFRIRQRYLRYIEDVSQET
jgi:hypothetical protein